ncbi:MAG: hypothetical protein IT368_09675 [Candidatus Hydrogenedentes bacterium]|nr:hypothetical protein [Candidatus Hydrogenedentota bacterium]
MNVTKEQSAAKVDRRDVAVGLVIGILFAIVKALAMKVPEWRAGGSSASMPCILTVAYIIWRARHEPEKLDMWGLTTPITGTAMLVMALFIGITVALLGVTGHMLGGTLHFEPHYVFGMINYVVAAFPQQFFLWSVGLTSLATLPVLRGTWRLPLVVGLCFALAHFWVPAHFSGSAIPPQVVATAPMGFFAAWYFLQFRNILPLTLFHVIAYVLYVNWVEHLV